VIYVHVVAMQGKRLYPFIKLPTQKQLFRFMSFAGPVFIFILCKIFFYTAMTMTVTASNDNVLLAAHTCMLKIYFLFTAFGDSGGQTGTYYSYIVTNMQCVVCTSCLGNA
jgi:hypothetical protein